MKSVNESDFINRKSVNEKRERFFSKNAAFVHGERCRERLLKISTNQLKSNKNRVNEKRNERTLLRVSFVHGRSIGGIRGDFVNGERHGS